VEEAQVAVMHAGVMAVAARYLMHCFTRGQRDSGRWRWFVAVLLCVDLFPLQQDSPIQPVQTHAAGCTRIHPTCVSVISRHADSIVQGATDVRDEAQSLTQA